jgi:hypothetical protein
MRAALLAAEDEYARLEGPLVPRARRSEALPGREDLAETDSDARF